MTESSSELMIIHLQRGYYPLINKKKKSKPAVMSVNVSCSAREDMVADKTNQNTEEVKI